MASPADALARFVQLSENRAALRATEQLATAVARDIDSPLLFVHGPPGSGKSHLARGLIERIAQGSAAKTAQTVTAAEFGRALLQLHVDRRPVIREATGCDLLVVEDVQHCPVAADDELATLLDRRLARRKAVVVTAARSPAQLNCSARLAGRFTGGLVVPIRPLGEPSRRALAAALCDEKKLKVTDDVIAWLASDPGSARPIIGNVLRLVQLAKVHRQPLTLPVVSKELPAPASNQTSMDRIVEMVAARRRLSPKMVAGPSRVANVVRARHLAMYLGRQLGLTLVEIGKHLGGRDHTTVMHGYGKIEAAVASDPQLNQEVRDLQAELL